MGLLVCCPGSNDSVRTNLRLTQDVLPCCSWALASPEELEIGLAWYKQMLAAGRGHEYLAERETIREAVRATVSWLSCTARFLLTITCTSNSQVGQTTTLVAFKPV